ncbi:MAG TPA: lysylphosphatidylglycerol synthase domain-containing protein [Chitinispirillaceae bacterium]|nr:lysylphosphatidylglycerol synthase domain-containing protein [Chitinispirillaceae bacterium]
MKIEFLIQKIKKLLLSGGKGSRYIQIGITIVFVILVNRSISTGEIGQLLQRIDPVNLLIIFSLAVAAVLVQAFRWYQISDTLSLPVSYTVALRRLLWGNLLAFITPGSVGELLRGVDLCPSKRKIMVFSILADRLSGNVIVVFSAIPVLVIELFFLHHQVPSFLSITTVVTTVCILLFFVLLHLCIRLGTKLPVKLQTMVSGVIGKINLLNFPRVIILSFLHHALLIMQAAYVLMLFVDVSFIGAVMVSTLAYTCMLFLPISIANIGIREYSFALLLPLAVAGEHSIITVQAASLGVSGLLLLMNIILPALAGLFWHTIPMLGRGRLKNETVKKMMHLQSSTLSKKKGLTDATGQI